MSNPTALVTGASSGIGEAFARALAARGHDLVLVARRAEVLQALGDALAQDHGVSTEVLVADLETDAGVGAVETRLRDQARAVDLLVNNAGFGTSGPFLELPVDGEESEIRLNVLALVRLTHAALGPMVQRGRGGVINISSVGAYQPIPTMATYGATKAFVSSFSNALHEEVKGKGVNVMVVAPGYTHTSFHERAKITSNANMPELMWQSADEVVLHALNHYERGKAVSIPGAINKMTVAFSATLPAGVSRKAAAMVARRQH